MSTVIVVRADLEGDPTNLIKAFQDSEKAARDFAAKTRIESNKVSTAWDGIISNLQSAQKTTSEFGTKTSELGSKLTSNITKPALIATTALAGIAAVGGWNRLVAIENATKSIESLGYSATDAAKIINTDVLAAVEGTAFSLAEAGTQAGAALASGIPPGRELTAQLKLIADATTRSTTDFSSMAQMLNQVEGSGKLTADMINRFTENGLFVLPMLQKEFGKTADEIRDMVSRGEIDSKTFARVLEENVGGAALLSGDTAQGAFANLRTAISNLGATALNDVFPLIKDAMMDLTAVFKSPEIKESLKEIGVIVADVFTQVVSFIKDAITWFAALDPGMQSFLLGLAAAAIAAGPVLVVVGKLATGISAVMGVFALAAGVIKGFTLATQGAAAVQAALAGATKGVAAAIKVGTAIQWLWNAALTANPIGIIIMAIAALVAALVWFFTQTDLGREIWANFTQFLTEAWTNIVNVATTVWTAVSTFFVDLWTGIVDTFTTAWDTISSFVTGVWTSISTFFSDLWATVTGVFTAAWEGIVAFLTPIFEFIAGLIQIYIEIWVNVFIVFAAILKTIWDGIVAVVTTVWNAIVEFITPIVTAIVEYVVTTFQQFVATWVAIWQSIVDFFTMIWNALVAFFTPIIQWISDVITTVVSGVSAYWQYSWGQISSFFASVWQGMVDFFTPIINFISSTISSVVSTIQGIWTSVWSSISSFFSSIWTNMVNAVSNAVGAIGRWVSGIYDTVMGVFSSVGTWLTSAGSDMIRGLWNGISDMFGWITDQIGGFMNGIVDWAKDVLGIASPSKVMMEVGFDTGRGIAVGLDKSHKMIVDASMNLIPDVPDPKKLTGAWTGAGDGGYGVPPWMQGGSAGQGGAGTGTVINIEIKVQGGSGADIDAMVDQMMDKLRFELGGVVSVP